MRLFWTFILQRAGQREFENSVADRKQPLCIYFLCQFSVVLAELGTLSIFFNFFNNKK